MSMRCHYEVMGVARDATSEEIKKQYKKLALVWHPDRNFGREEEATHAFKEISTAYSVLNDPQERKWYDDHRESILRGKDGTRGEDEDEDDDNIANQLNLWHYFNPTCYDEYNDDENGFYTVYRDIFSKISEKEFEAAGSSASRKKHDLQYPTFGTSTSPADEVLSFYASWDNFISSLSFANVDKYNVLEAPNRQVRRAMEKENSKFRETARKEYIALIKSLIAYVKKRDERYISIINEKQRLKEEETKKKNQQKLIEKEKRKELKEQWKLTQEEEEENRAKEREGAFLLANNDSDDDFAIDDAEEGGGGGSSKKRRSKKKKNRPLWNVRMVNEHQDFDEENGGADDMELYQQIKKLNLKKGGGGDVDLPEGPEVESSPVPVEKEASPIPSEAAEGEGIEGGDGEEDDEEEEEEEEEIIYHCEICSKSFKSEPQLNQHLSSKPHRKKAQDLQKQQSKKK